MVFDYISYKDFTGKDMIRVSRLCYVLALCNDVVKFLPLRQLVFRKLHEECEAELQSRLGNHIGSVFTSAIFRRIRKVAKSDC